MYYSNIELQNISEETPIEYIDKVLHLNDLELSKAILEIKMKESKNISKKVSANLDDLISNNALFGFHYRNCRFNLLFRGLEREIIALLLIDTVFRKNLGSYDNLKTVLSSLLRRLSYVKDYQLCVYNQAVKWQANHCYDTPFSIEDILPVKDCPYREQLNAYFEDDCWFCPFYVDEYCDVDIKNYKRLLDSLCEINVLEPLDSNKYKFVF